MLLLGRLSLELVKLRLLLEWTTPNEVIIILSWRLDYCNLTLLSENIVKLRLLNSFLCLRLLHYTQRFVGKVIILLYDCGI